MAMPFGLGSLGPRSLSLGLVAITLTGCVSREAGGENYHGHGVVVLPPGTRVVGVTAGKSLRAVRFNAPLRTAEAVRSHAKDAGIQSSRSELGILGFPVGFTIGALTGAIVGVDEDKLSASRRAIEAALADARLELRVLEACEGRLKSLSVESVLELPDGIPAEPLDPAVRSMNPRHPLAKTEVELVLGYWLSSVGFITPGQTPDTNDFNSAQQFSVTVELATVHPRNWSSAGGVTFVYHSEARHKFTEWAENDARLLRAELERFLDVLARQLEVRVQVATTAR